MTELIERRFDAMWRCRDRDTRLPAVSKLAPDHLHRV